MTDRGHALAYLHGTHPAEQARLTRLQSLVNATSLRSLDLRVGEQVLELGAGLGHFARDMAAVVGPSGRVLGIEAQPEQLARSRDTALPPGLELRQGTAEAPPLTDAEWGSFDVVHARFLLEHVPDPGAVVAVMARAVRPGGRVVLQDDDHDLLRLHPAHGPAEDLWRAYIDTYARAGLDPFVGRHLVSLLHGAGLRPLDNDLLFFGGCHGGPGFELVVDNFVGIVEGARAPIVAAGRFDEAAFDAALRGFRAWAERPDAAFWYATCWARGARPAAP